MKKKVIISAALLLAPVFTAVVLRTYDNYQYDSRQYGNQANITQTIIQQLKDGQWTDVRSESFTYNENGQVLETTYQIAKAEEWVNRNKMVHSYDEKTGYEVERNWNVWDKSSWQPNLRFRSERDNKGRSNVELIHEFKNEEWVLVRKNETTYDPTTDTKNEQVYYNRVDEKWVLSWKDEYKFENKNLIRKTGYRWAEGEWQLTLNTDYAYTGKNLRSQEIMSRKNDQDDQPFRRTRFTYDEVGSKTISSNSVMKDGAWVDQEKHLHHYKNL